MVDRNSEKRKEEKNQYKRGHNWLQGEGSECSRQDKLPSFEDAFENMAFDCHGRKGEEFVEDGPEVEGPLVRILPGVIRHTSCPDTSLAYYYCYRQGV